MVCLFGVAVAFLIPLYTFFILKRKLSIENSGAIAAGLRFSECGNICGCGELFGNAAHYFWWTHGGDNGLDGSAAIIIGVLLIRIYSVEKSSTTKFGSVVLHSFTNGSVLMIIGSLVIGLLTSDQQAEGIKPFTTDIFKGFLAIFLLDMGIVSGRKLNDFLKAGGLQPCLPWSFRSSTEVWLPFSAVW